MVVESVVFHLEHRDHHGRLKTGRTRSQYTTGTSLQRDESAGKKCVSLPILVQNYKVPILSLAGPPGLAVFLCELDSDRRAKTDDALF